MRPCISTDNGRMSGGPSREEGQRNHPGLPQDHRSLGKAGRAVPREGAKPSSWGRSRHRRCTALARLPGAHPPLEREHILDSHNCKEHRRPASPPHASMEISADPSLRATRVLLNTSVDQTLTAEPGGPFPFHLGASLLIQHRDLQQSRVVQCIWLPLTSHFAMATSPIISRLGFLICKMGVITGSTLWGW